jgi:hypothetical protein
MVHLVSRVLRELKVQVVVAESEDVPAGFEQ